MTIEHSRDRYFTKPLLIGLAVLVLTAGAVFVSAPGANAATTVTQGVGPDGWKHNKQREVFFNGENFFLLYQSTNSSPTSMYKTSTDGITWSATSTIVTSPNAQSFNYAWDYYLVDDHKFDNAYSVYVATCTISGTSISCPNTNATIPWLNAASICSGATISTLSAVSVARSPYSNRVFVVWRYDGSELCVISADQAGDVNSNTTWTAELSNQETNVVGEVTMVPYANSDCVLVMYQRDPGGTGSDGIYSRKICRGGGAGTQTQVVVGANQALAVNFGNAIRISDTDFRYVDKETTSGLNRIEERKWNDTAWSLVSNICSGCGNSPALFYDRPSNSLHALRDSVGAILRQLKASDGTWSSNIVADNSENAGSLPVTMMHSAPTDFAREPRQLVWAYRVANGSTFDLKVGNLPLTGSTTQRQYLFQNDDGGANGDNAASSTTRAGAATSTSISNVKLGERMVVRFQVDNSSLMATTTKAFRLQWQNQTDDNATWNDLALVGTTTITATTSDRINAALSEYGAPATRGRRLPIPSRWLTTSCNSSATFVPGEFVAGTGTSTPIALGPGQCTELAYVIETSGAKLGKTYRLRLIDGTNSKDFTQSNAGGYFVPFFYPNTDSTDSSVGTVNWIDTFRIKTDDSADSIAALPGLSTSTYLTGTNFGFNVGAGAVIEGIKVEVKRKVNINNNIHDYSVRLIKGGTIVGDNKATADVWGTTYLTTTYGGQNDLWGTTWAPADINASNFGVAFSAENSYGLGREARVDYIRVTVYTSLNEQTYPTFTTESTRSISYSKGAYGATTTIAMDGAGFDGGRYASLIIGPNGLPNITHQNATVPPQDLYLARCLNSTCTSTSSIAFDGPDFPAGKGTSLVLDAYGNLIAAHKNFGSWIHLARCLNSGCTATATVRTDANNSTGDAYPSVVLSSEGNPVIAYQNSSYTDLFVTRCLNPTCSATTTVDLDGVAANHGSYNSIALLMDGNIAVAHNDAFSPASLFFTYCANPSCASTSTISMQLGNAAYYASLALTSDGRPVIAYQNNTTLDLHIAFCFTSICSATSSANAGCYGNQPCTATTTVPIDGAGFSAGKAASLAIPSDGNPVVAHIDTINNQVRLARCLNALCSATSSIAVTAASTADDYTSLAIGTDGNPLIAFASTTGIADLFLVKCYAIDCTNSAPPTGTSSLTWTLDNKGYTAVATDDGSYDTVSGKNARLVYDFFKANTNNTDAITLSWNGQVSESVQTTLELYNFTTGTWQGYATSSTPTVDNDFSLAPSCVSSSDYYGPGNTVAARVLTATTSSNSTSPSLDSHLKTDSMSITFGASGGGHIIQSAFSQEFQLDDPSLPNAGITVRAANSVCSQITSGNDIRIKIPSTISMEWDTTDQTSSIGGNAAAKVNQSTVTFDNARTLKIDVTSDFAAGDEITIGGLAFRNFSQISGPDSLTLYTDGPSDTGIDGTDNRTKKVTPRNSGAPGGVSEGGAFFQFPAIGGVFKGGGGPSEGAAPFQQPAPPAPNPPSQGGGGGSE